MKNEDTIAIKVLLPLVSIFLAFQSYKLVSSMHQFKIESVPALLLIAWLINMFVTGVFALTGFVHPTQKLLPDVYYSIRNPELLTRVYNFLRVGLFRKFLLATIWKNRRKQKTYFNGKKSGFSNLAEQSRKAEFGHLIPFVILLLISIYFLLIHLPMLGFFVLLWNLLGNLYPVILQRHHRMRIQRIMNS